MSTRRVSKPLCLFLAALLPGLSLAQVEEEERLDFSFNARMRWEDARQDNALLDASALTLRLRAGLETAEWNHFSALAEVEAVEALDDDFNSGGNGRTQFSPILDPEDAEVNQLLIRYRDGPHNAQLGRQRMVLDNARFFGDVDFRQNQQTFDALSYMNTALPGQQFRYVYMTRARRFLSDENPLGEIDMNSHLLHYRLQQLNSNVFSAYAYLIDMDTPAVVQNSTKTFGFSYSGTYASAAGDLLYRLEYANQSDYGGGAATNDADYLAAEAGLKLSNEWVLKVGQERLGGDGVYGFQTPFGTNHKFNGLADVFAARTPANGLIDSYARLVIPLYGARILLAAHDFGADAGRAAYGSELDLRIERRFAERFGITLLVADYRAEDFAVDTRRFLIWLDFRY